MVLKNKLLVRQEVELAEIFTGFETGNRYSILDEQGNKILYAYEDRSNFLTKQLLGSHRNLELHLIDQNNKNSPLGSIPNLKVGVLSTLTLKASFWD